MRRPNSRVILLPIMVLVFALGLSWWSKRERERAAVLADAIVTDLCAAAGRGEDLRDRLLTGDANEALRLRLADAVEVVCGTGGAPDITVAAGPGPDAGDASPATHHAIIAADGAPRLGLRVEIEGDAAQVVGYWIPQPEDH